MYSIYFYSETCFALFIKNCDDVTLEIENFWLNVVLEWLEIIVDVLVVVVTTIDNRNEL